MPNWTPDQRGAIEARQRDILVSAAAGSGKTAVLIERILTLLRQGASLEKMLVITFTRAAAAEMRERLEDKLSQEAEQSPHLRRQYVALGRANISTLHTFCRQVIQRYFEAADTDPLSRVDDGVETRALFGRALDEEMEALYASTQEDDRHLTLHYTDEQIQQMAQDLYRFLLAQAQPWQWLESWQTMPDAQGLFHHPWYQTARQEALFCLDGALSLLNQCQDIAGCPDGPGRYAGNAQQDLALVGFLQQELQKTGRLPAGAGTAFGALSRARASASEMPARVEEFKHRRDAAKALVAQAVALLPQEAQQAQNIVEDLHFTLPGIRAISGLVRRLHGRYAQYKQAKQLWDYNDLEHLALHVLEDPLAAQAVGESFDMLFVDEYQDISRIQEAIISRARGGASLFMVGDVKQSIYRFRLADPSLFLEKYHAFQQKVPSQQAQADSRLILLSENFRSTPNILAAVNLVFRNAMRPRATEIAYDEQAALYTSAAAIQDTPPVELHIICREDQQDQQKGAEDRGDVPEEAEEEGPAQRGVIYEARLLARRIRELVGTPLTEAQTGEQRPARYRDMVVLLRSASGRAAQMARELAGFGIPVYSQADAQYFDVREVDDVLNILRVLDNPYQDIPLLSALACPAFDFTPEELARIRAASPLDIPFYEAFFARAPSDAHVAAAVARLDSWRFLAQNLPLERFMRRLVRESGLYARAGALEGGALRRANLRLLCERAGASAGGMPLHLFLERVRQARLQDTSQAASSLGEQEDVVRIMTIHKSKGLEFPIVFLPDLARAFRLKEGGEMLLCDAHLGLAMRYRNEPAQMTHATFATQALQNLRARQTRSEEARLLYVAMTRARQRLILVATPRHLAASRRQWSLPGDDYAAGSAANMMDWLGNTLWPVLQTGQDMLWRAPAGSIWEIAYHQQAALLPPAAAPRAPLPPWPQPQQVPVPDPFGPPFALRRSQLFKASVTSLLTGAFPTLEDEEETPEIKRRALRLDTPLPPLPQLGQARPLSAQERGAAAHKLLGQADLARLRGLHGQQLLAALQNQLDDLAGRSILLPAEGAACRLEDAAAFFESALGQRLLHSPQVQREWAFTLQAEDGLLLQGVIDACFVEEGAWVALDYKTDHAPVEEITLTYRNQMRWYMRALREITGLPVKEAWLYGLHARQALAVTEENPITLAEIQPKKAVDTAPPPVLS